MVAVLFGISLSIKWKREGQSQRQLLARTHLSRGPLGSSALGGKAAVVMPLPDRQIMTQLGHSPRLSFRGLTCRALADADRKVLTRAELRNLASTSSRTGRLCCAPERFPVAQLALAHANIRSGIDLKLEGKVRFRSARSVAAAHCCGCRPRIRDSGAKYFAAPAHRNPWNSRSPSKHCQQC